jgi:hypothetical protein
MTFSFPKPNARWPPVTQIIIHHYFMMQSAGPRSLRDHLPACVSTRPHRARKGQPIRIKNTAPLHKVAPALANYLHFYIIRLLPHSFPPVPSLSLSPIRLACPGVNMISNPNSLLFSLKRAFLIKRKKSALISVTIL